MPPIYAQAPNATSNLDSYATIVQFGHFHRCGWRIEKANINFLVLQSTYVIILEVHDTRPEDNIHFIAKVNEAQTKLSDCDLTTATTGCPVEGEFRFFAITSPPAN